ncbi:ec041526-734b-460a-a8ee-9da8ae60d6b1 [Thermothielavioides terrestris]|uniref:FAD-binding domain-containing protein n=2 Tax=Thermothielavioides terrestris TaxID=2587410 RepID=G2R160_THETT|nr:uncharacterized protein THITE_2076116 [Thermothielavioides terrestris NRRL 8126]AEO67350.1 hypothetical protein THITE_2076116 [Thermothielavioides terrestris NRRL 8126]SPQ24061.1 ec041526-734b-460a-a8ee-9da8ae60d6b1 [Thermothielavioides terrestris]
MASTNPPDWPQDGLHVAIVGAGITGVNLALGLLARNVSFTVYERAPGFREIGAGIGFSPNAERAMGLLNPDVLAAFKRAANPNGEDYFQWIDGYRSDELIFKLYVGKDGFQGGLRSEILEAWAQLLPPGAVRFNKEIDTISAPPEDNSSSSSSNRRLRLHFKDGTTATADAVIGCDGIRSRVRQLLFPTSSSSSSQSPEAGYTAKFCFRALAPMPAAMAALGQSRSMTRFMYNGPGAHIITYPVASNTLLNILAVISDPSPTWRAHPQRQQHTAPGSRSEAEAAFRDWHPTARRIVGLLPDAMDKWAIFDMAARPAPRYIGTAAAATAAAGDGEGWGDRVCVAGDAAHAAGPHLGAGGGMGIEDALVLSELLAAVDGKVTGGGTGDGGDEREREKGRWVSAALEAYNAVLYERTQGVVRATREACDLFQWKDPAVATDPRQFGDRITALFHSVWEYDVAGMVEEALAELE